MGVIQGWKKCEEGKKKEERKEKEAHSTERRSETCFLSERAK